MLLASVADLISRLGFDPMTDITNAITMALDAAEPQLAALLNSEFDRGNFIDTFYVSSPPYMDGPAVSTEFRLRRGLVNTITSVLMNSDPTAFADPTSTTDVTAVTILLGDKGVVRDHQTRYHRQYVQITYNAGFDPDGTNADSYNLTQVPQWLQQAAKLRALLGVADDASLSEANIKLDTKMLNGQLTSLLMRHARYAPMALLPL